MIDGRKICLTIPAGRQRYMELLVPQLLREEGWDELQIWVNTADPADRAYLESLPARDPRIRLIELPAGVKPDGGPTIHHFYPHCIESGTVYIRLDDDVCYVEPGAIARIARFRIANPKAFVVFPIIINNAIVTHVLQVLGRITHPKYIRAQCMERTAWHNPDFAETLHRTFLRALEEGDLDRFRFTSRPIALSRMSINCISWLGEEFAKFDGRMNTYDEEEWLSVVRPTQLGGYNLICGDAIVAHFSFYTQREHLDQTDILNQYRRLAGL